jgi:hypothetical protein
MKLSAILTFHGEAFLGAPSVRSAEASIRHFLAERPGSEVEAVVYLDRPTARMREAASSIVPPGWAVHELDFGDQGAVRNHAAGAAAGEYIAFLDGDDLWSENWLARAADRMDEMGGKAIVHPELYYFFEGSNNVLVVPDSTTGEIDPLLLCFVNPWDALCFSPREVHLIFPYAKRDISAGFAYEDWQWSFETFLAGWPHVPAADSIIFKRRRADSQTTKASARNVLTNRAAFHSLKRLSELANA